MSPCAHTTPSPQKQHDSARLGSARLDSPQEAREREVRGRAVVAAQAGAPVVEPDGVGGGIEVGGGVGGDVAEEPVDVEQGEGGAGPPARDEQVEGRAVREGGVRGRRRAAHLELDRRHVVLRLGRPVARQRHAAAAAARRREQRHAVERPQVEENCRPGGGPDAGPGGVG